MQGEEDDAGAHHVRDRVEDVGMAAGNEDLVELVHGSGRGDHDPRDHGRVAPETRPQQRGHAAEGERVHELVPREARQALDHARLVEDEHLHEERREGQQAGCPEPGRRGKELAHG